MDSKSWLSWLRRSSSTKSKKLKLEDLPNDVLARIFLTLMQPVEVSSHPRIIEQSYAAALPLSQTSTRFHSLFHQQLTDLELWQSGRIDDNGLVAIARSANVNINRLILRKCSNISVIGLHALALYCTNLRTLDLSYMDLSDIEFSVVINGASTSLRSLLIRGCKKLTDQSLQLIGNRCHQLEALDICALPLISDDGIHHLAKSLNDRLTMIVCSECPNLTDKSLESFGQWCPNIEVFTCRSLPLITNAGLDSLCKGSGRNLDILDIFDCDQLQVKGFLDSVKQYCPLLAKRYENADGKTLKQIVISSLSGFIFHVTGSDIQNGKSAVYFLIVDSGTSDSFRVSIGSSSLDLTNYGSILASCFGDTPNEHVKRTLLQRYGLDLDSDENESNREE